MTFGWCTFTRQGFFRTLARGASYITGMLSRPTRGVLKYLMLSQWQLILFK